MKTNNFYMAIFFICALFRLLVIPINTDDLSVWITDGLYFLENYQFARVDYISIHEGLEFIYPARLGNIFFAILYKVFGLTGTAIAFRIFSALTIIFIYRGFIHNKIKWNPLNLFISSLTFIWFIPFLDRPPIFGILFFTIFLKLYEKGIHKSSDFLKLGATIVLWNNLHSSVMILLPLFIYRFLKSLFLKEEQKISLILLILFISLLNISPEGYHIFTYTLKTVLTSKARNFDEWRSIFYFGSPYMILSYLLVFLFLIYKVHKEKKWRELINLDYCVLLITGIFSLRNTVWLFLLTPLILTKQKLWSKIDNNYFTKAKINFMAIGTLVSLILYQSPFVNPSIDLIKNQNLIPITDYLKHSSKDHRIFNGINIGSFLVLKQPHPNFWDLRNTIFPDKVFKDYLKIAGCEKTCKEELAKYQINTIVIKNNESYLFTFLQQEWTLAKQSEDFYLFEKSDVYKVINSQ